MSSGGPPNSFPRRPAVGFDFLAPVAVLAVLGLELRRLRHGIENSGKRILPQARIYTLLADMLGKGAVRARRAAARERDLMGH